ncbi:hypothetical protein O181_019464 [Austropuccinia psidii MF-1]|uniref:Integrase catalytic domain-containing protein n=1 Tax=Austropuccinia psidii MF-1 TaxID=1389203 RepID=A0A9Q3C9J9_9BASI|nr:hypothetical protein [Austropuccinia psidii MF-1]
MDLPPLFFNAFLEEKWDKEAEQEEIETVLKVVPPSYHQYLDVFSNFKAEKLPPHCACDHHIEMEGLLPPILKESFTTDPILSHFNTSLPPIVDTDVSAYALGAVLTQIFISSVFSKHCLPVSIFSDRGSLFVSSFWTNLFQQLKISRDLSASSHPETEGQTEWLKQILEQHIWMYFSYHRDDWNTWLPLAEFACNTVEHSSTKKSPFYIIYGANSSFDSIHISQDSPTGNLSMKLQSVWKVVKGELESAMIQFSKYTSRNRTITPDLQPGDKAWLPSKNIKTKRPTKKLSRRWFGPFEVLKKIGSPAYHLKLPLKCKSVYPAFLVSLLKPVKQ